MANPERGEYSFDANGKTWKLKGDVNAMCAIEGVTGRHINDVLARLQNQALLTLTLARAVVWAALQHHHPDTTIKDAGDLMQALGADEAMAFAVKAVVAAFPKAAEEPDPARPPEATVE